MDIMFYEVYAEEESALKRFLPDSVEAGFLNQTTPSNASPPPAFFISTRTQSIIPERWAKHLHGVLTRSTGYDHIQDFLNRSGTKIPCGYLPDYCARSMAEQVMLMILALNRRLKLQIKQFASFHRDGLTGSECLNKRVLVVGVGRVGQEVVRLAGGLGMKVSGVDIVRSVKTLNYVTLERGVREADVIVCALPLTAATRGLLDYDCLKKVRPGTLFINISRGEISPAGDLKDLLDEGILGGLALDVYANESRIAEALRLKGETLTEEAQFMLSLGERDNVIFTPHNAFNTREALERKARQTCESVASFLKKKSFPNPV